MLTVNRTHPTAVMFKNKQQDRGGGVNEAVVWVEDMEPST